MDLEEEIIRRIGAVSKQEKEAWREVIKGMMTLLFFRLKRRVDARPSYYKLTDEQIKRRIHSLVGGWMLHIVEAVRSAQADLDYPGAE